MNNPLCPSNKIDSNVTGLRYAEELCLKQLPPNPIWNALEPNSYSDFGGNISTVARNPINPSRQRRKGTVTDLEASGGFNQDLTQNNTTDIMQGFMFADARQHGTNAPYAQARMSIESVTAAGSSIALNTTGALGADFTGGAYAGTGYSVGQVVTVSGGTFEEEAQFIVTGIDPLDGSITSVVPTRAGRYSVAPANPVATTGGTGNATLTVDFDNLVEFRVGERVLFSGFTNGGNNGFKTVSSFDAGVLTVEEAVIDEAAPPATAEIRVVGYEFNAADAAIEMNGLLVRLTSAGGVDFTTMGLIPGEWLFLGGDLTVNHFDTNFGFARISAIEVGYLEFDKVTWAPSADPGTDKSLQVYFGDVIRNEADPELITRRTYQLERTLGQDANGTMSEYLIGAVPNELTLNCAQADKVTVDLGFIACDAEQRSGLIGLKPGVRPSLPATDAFNTSSDFSRIKLASVSAIDAAPTPLFAFATDMSVTINNNVSANKALGVLGAFDTTAGTFEVGGEITAYFASVAAVQAVRNNADITMDVIMVKNNAGLLFDIPLLALGNGRINIEQDQPVTVPLETNAAESKFGHTLLFQSFPYLPTLADL